MKIATRAGVKRLGVLVLLVIAAGSWSWWAMIRMPLKSYAGPWVPLSETEQALREELRAEVDYLGAQIGDRNVAAYFQLRAVAEHIAREFSETGYEVRRLGFDVNGQTCLNLEVEIAGQSRPKEIVVAGAHYDSVVNCPGANDNGSGVAALLSLARRFAKEPLARTLRFVAFVNEEPPYFQTEKMGSRVYAKLCRERGDSIAAMLSLETIGYYSDTAGSQRYPFPIGMFYPSTGNFIAFVGNTASSDLVRRCVESFRRQVQFPSEGAALPSAIPGVGWSDHWSFWQEGYPAIMLTDTAPFRYPYYHTAHDTPDKLDYDRMARVVAGLEKVIRELVE